MDSNENLFLLNVMKAKSQIRNKRWVWLLWSTLLSRMSQKKSLNFYFKDTVGDGKKLLDRKLFWEILSNKTGLTTKKEIGLNFHISDEISSRFQWFERNFIISFHLKSSLETLNLKNIYNKHFEKVLIQTISLLIQTILENWIIFGICFVSNRLIGWKGRK